MTRGLSSCPVTCGPLAWPAVRPQVPLAEGACFSILFCRVRRPHGDKSPTQRQDARATTCRPHPQRVLRVPLSTVSAPRWHSPSAWPWKRISPLRLCSLVCKRVTQSLLQKARAKRLASDTGLAFVGAEEVSLPHLSPAVLENVPLLPFLPLSVSRRGPLFPARSVRGVPLLYLPGLPHPRVCWVGEVCAPRLGQQRGLRREQRVPE